MSGFRGGRLEAGELVSSTQIDAVSRAARQHQPRDVTREQNEKRKLRGKIPGFFPISRHGKANLTRANPFQEMRTTSLTLVGKTPLSTDCREHPPAARPPHPSPAGPQPACGPPPTPHPGGTVCSPPNSPLDLSAFPLPGEKASARLYVFKFLSPALSKQQHLLSVKLMSLYPSPLKSLPRAQL